MAQVVDGVVRARGRAVVALAACLSLAGVVVPVAPADAAPLATTGACKVAAGMYSSEWEARADHDDHADWAGKTVQFGGTFHDVDENDTVADPSFSNTEHILEEVWAAGTVPFANLGIQSTALQIAAGSRNADIDDWAGHLNDWLAAGEGRSLILAPLHEGNWDGTPYGGDPINYIRAYQLVRSRVLAVVDNDGAIRWAFAPNNHSSVGEIADYYPGNAFVDVLGVSGFNFGSDQTDDRTFHSVHTVFDAALDEFRAITRAKPYILSEVGSSQVGGDQGRWLRDLFTYATADPNIVGLVYFNFDKETDWRVWDGDVGSSAWREQLQLPTTVRESLSTWFQGGALPFRTPDRQPRHFGENRILTAVALSQYGWDAANTVVIARSDVYADALAGGPLAHFVGGPILLTPSTTLAPQTRQEIQRLGADRAIILGGTEAISSQVQQQLGQVVQTTLRVAGNDRFETAVAVAKAIAPTHDDVYVTEGANIDPLRGWPDAVSASWIAARQGRPVLFVRTNDVPGSTRSGLAQLGTKRATIVGGPVAVSNDTQQAIEGLGVSTGRLSGDDRYATSTAVAAAGPSVGLDEHHTWFATGRNWPDALTAGPLVARCGGVLVLVHGTAGLDSSSATRTWLDQRATTFVQNHLVGGEAVITADVATELRTSAAFKN